MGGGHLGIPKVPYIKTSLKNSKDFTENKETFMENLKDTTKSEKSHGLRASAFDSSAVDG